MVIDNLKEPSSAATFLSQVFSRL